MVHKAESEMNFLIQAPSFSCNGLKWSGMIASCCSYNRFLVACVPVYIFAYFFCRHMCTSVGNLTSSNTLFFIHLCMCTFVVK